MIKLLVIADDFTGALDTGVQFSKRGIPTMVSTDTTFNFNEMNEEVDVLVIDTESRYLRFEEAYSLIHRIIVSAKSADVPFIYKKVDYCFAEGISVLRLKAVLDAKSSNCGTVFTSLSWNESCIK